MGAPPRVLVWHDDEGDSDRPRPRTLGERVRVVARNEDDHVEGIEVDGAPNVLAVQWHPELLRHRPGHLALFAQLVGSKPA